MLAAWITGWNSSSSRMELRRLKSFMLKSVVLDTAYHLSIERFIGCTAEGVLNRGPCSLMIVKPLPDYD